MVSFAQILARIITKEGIAVFREPVRFLSIAADLSGNQHEEDLEFLYVLGKLGHMPTLKKIYQSSDIQQKKSLWDELEAQLLQATGLPAGTLDTRLEPYAEALGVEFFGVAKRLREQAEKLLAKQKADEEAARLAKQKVTEAAARLIKQNAIEEAARLLKQNADEEAIRLAKQKSIEAAARLIRQKADEEATRLAKQKADEDAAGLTKQKADAEAEKLARRKAIEEATRLAKQKAAEEAARLAKQKADEEAARLAKQKADEEAARLAKQKAAEKAAKLAKQKAAEEAAKLAAQKQLKKNRWKLALGILLACLGIATANAGVYPVSSVSSLILAFFIISNAMTRSRQLREAAGKTVRKKKQKT